VGTERREGVDVRVEDLAEALRRFVPVTTSRPAPAEFLQVYEELAAAGADSIVSVHISADMSATVQGAQLAAAQSPVPVTVVDSRVLGAAMGYAVLSAAAAAGAGADAETVAAVARSRAHDATVVFYVHTLEHLRRGGRIGSASALLGSALAIKPILALADGHIAPIEKVRTSSKALARMVELAGDAADRARTAGRIVDIEVQHLDFAARASEVADALAQRGARRGRDPDRRVGRRRRRACGSGDAGDHGGASAGEPLVSGSQVVAGLPQLVAGPLDLGSGELWRTVAVVVVAGAASFLWGGINPATLIGRTLGRDVTRAGSGNPGATNAGRVLGRKWGILVGVLDVAKGFVPAFLGAVFGSVWLAYVLGVAAVLGHVFSPYLRGRGGKGVATALGAILGVHPWYAVALLAVFVLVFAVSRWVALGVPARGSAHARRGAARRLRPTAGRHRAADDDLGLGVGAGHRAAPSGQRHLPAAVVGAPGVGRLWGCPQGC
jgi:acyl-phosphate glycerol 3-phosphate acyltransferase